MPVKITRISKGRYRVSTPGGIKSKSTSKKNALAQERIINAAEAGHPFIPARKGK